MQNSDFWTRKTSLYGSQTWPVVLCMQNSVPSFRITSLYGSPPLSVVLCMQNSYFRTRHTSLYGSQTSPVIWCMQIIVPSIVITNLYGSQPSSVVFACKTATLGPELQVSVGPRPHLGIFHAKQRLLDQNNKSIWVPDMTCLFMHAKHRE